MPANEASTRRRARKKPRAARERRAAVPTKLWTHWAALAVGLLVLLAAAPLWWTRGAVGAYWLAAGSAVVLGVATIALLRRALHESRTTTQALDQFSQRLRDGDVSGALRAVRADSVSSGDSGHSSGVASGSWPAVSRFGSVAREVESVLGDRERRWQARMRLSADWHWETDLELRFSWVSRDLASLVKLGVQPGDLIGRRLDAVPMFQPPEDGWAALNERMAHHKALRDVVLEVRRPGRASMWVALNGRAHRDETGSFAGYEGVGRDVTEQRLAYLKLAESERRHALMAELSVDWYWQTDAQHNIEELGQVARDLLGERATEALGQPRWTLNPDGATDAEWAAHRADLDAHRPFRGFDYAIRQPGRGLRWISIGGQPRFDARGEFVGYHGVGRDITLRKRAERVLLNRNQALERQVAERTAELEQSNRDLEAFSRQLAHELRTPIGQVAGLADLLKSRAWERLAEDEREWLRLQGQAAREMSHTVTALLELAHSASTALLLEAVDLTAVAQAVIEDLPWVERQSPVEWAVEPGLTAHCSAPLARVVLMNLLGNAAKFTRDVAAPRIEFRRCGDDGRSGGEGSFVVSDNGAGFDAERAATLFQPFVRLHRSDQFQGTGLGLSIVRRIVERHGGSVTAFGEPGRGARFVFRFGPARAESAEVADSTRQADLSDAA
jgi:PAS domain S-box-containing protein